MSDQETDTEAGMRAFAKALFGAEETDETAETAETEDEPQKPTGNFVPREGTIPKPKDDSDLGLVRLLFDN